MLYIFIKIKETYWFNNIALNQWFSIFLLVHTYTRNFSLHYMLQSIKKLIIQIYVINIVIGFSLMVVSAFLAQITLYTDYCTNCTLEIIKRQCNLVLILIIAENALLTKVIPAFGFNTHHCREALLTLPCDGEYYDNI